ncbi:MAG: tRNA1(Val) (adenine(37)-N6)-methyltransferase [Desulfovibrio sp.]
MVTAPDCTPGSASARERFPGGLIQPPGSFRFSLDALLLASFIVNRALVPEKPASLLDLGCGCGVVGLACLLAHDTLTVCGADREPLLVDAARENARLLGIADRFSVVCGDFSSEKVRAALAPERVDVVAANMPYHREGSGRVPQSPLRRRALFADSSTIPSFLLAAAGALRSSGRFCLIYPWRDCESLLAALRRYGFFIEEVVSVYTSIVEKTLCLVSASPRPVAARGETTLRLRGDNGEYTEEAHRFCRWL